MAESITYNAWAAAQLRAGASPESVDASRLSGVYLEWLGAVRSVNGGDRRAAFDEFSRAHPQGQRLSAEIFRISPGAPAPKPDDEAASLVMVNVPDLPTSASLTAAQARQAPEAGEYLNQYCDYVYKAVNTLPREFNEAAALYTLSLVVARRLHVTTYFEQQLFPILWVLWVAGSTVFHKTTGLNLARGVCRHNMGHLMLPHDNSRDALIHKLAGKAPPNMDQLSLFEKQQIDRGRLHAGQRGIVVDEASSLFSGFRKDFNAGAVEVFLKAYDCEEQLVYSTLKHGDIYVRWLYMPLLGATTPASIQTAANLYMWQNGFWPRFVPLVPERTFPDRLIHADDQVHRPAEIDLTLRELSNRLPEPEMSLSEPIPPRSIRCSIDGEVWLAWKKFADVMLYDLQHPTFVQDDRLRRLYGRMPVKLLQVATLLAALDWPTTEDAPRIRMPHYARAHQIVETWRVNAHRFVAVMDQPLEGEDHEGRILSTIRQLAAAGTHPTTREIHRVLHWQRDKIEGVLAQMERDGLIEAADTTSKRSKFWRISQE